MKNSHYTQATNTETQENNKIIAEFMGYEIQKDPTERFFGRYKTPITKVWVKENELSFDSDWNWLMPVLIEIGNKTGFALTLGENYCYWNNDGENPFAREYGGYDNILNIYEAVVDLIKWYNENK